MTVEPLRIIVCKFRDHQVLPVKLEGKAFLGPKGKKWVENTHLVASVYFFTLHVGVKNSPFKGQRWYSRPSRLNRTPRLSWLSRIDGMCISFALYNLSVTFSDLSVNCTLLCVLICPLLSYNIKGPPWHWWNGRKRWETGTAGRSHTCNITKTQNVIK